MHLQVEGVSQLSDYGETIRLSPVAPDDVVVGIFNGAPEAARTIHLQPAKSGSYYRILARPPQAQEVLSKAILDSFIAPRADGPGYVAAESCRIFLERTPYGLPLVDPDYFYVASPRPHPQTRPWGRFVRNVSGLFVRMPD